MINKLKYLCVLPFIALTILALTFGVADIFALQASEYEDKWKIADAVYEKADWDKAHSSLINAMTLNPYNPDYPEMMGRVYIWRYYIDNAPVISEIEAQNILTDGLEYVHLSIKLRPAWYVIYSTERRLIRAAERVKSKIKANAKK
ncbi:MAG: hypothetical protein ACJA0C_000210 [Candidatus Endobugula sp.]